MVISAKTCAWHLVFQFVSPFQEASRCVSQVADDMTKLDARDLLVADNLILDPDVKKVDYLLNRCGEHISNKIRLKKKTRQGKLVFEDQLFSGGNLTQNFGKQEIRDSHRLSFFAGCDLK